MLTTVKEHMEIIKGLEGLGWQEILGFSNQQLLLFTKEIDTEKKRRILKQLPIEWKEIGCLSENSFKDYKSTGSRNFSL